jgi:cellulose synthase/poly-beta-1,6-N-acetylglucosamine synthase-like glycosyltransferase
MRTALAAVLWTSLGLIIYTHVGYPLLLAALARVRRWPALDRSFDRSLDRDSDRPESGLPRVSLIVAAHDEEAVIERRVENALALDYPPERLEVIVASDGSADRTVGRARAAAADGEAGRVRVLDLPRRGKVRTQDAAADEASGDVLAFSDANALWKPDCLRLLVGRLAEPRVGYVCGQLRYLAADGTNQEGAYWRYETAVRGLESRIGSITAGNGAVYAVRREAYLRLDPRTSHDLSFPFNLVKRGWRAVYEPLAVAAERPLASIEGEFRRKRRMMSHAWPAVLAGGMLNPRGYGLLYALEVYSHRLLRYATPLLHLVALGANVPLAFGSTLYAVTLGAQVAFGLAALLGRLTGGRPRLLGLAYYYVVVTASLAAGLWDWLRHGTPATWERAEGRP